MYSSVITQRLWPGAGLSACAAVRPVALRFTGLCGPSKVSGPRNPVTSGPCIHDNSPLSLYPYSPAGDGEQNKTDSTG